MSALEDSLSACNRLVDRVAELERALAAAVRERDEARDRLRVAEFALQFHGYRKSCDIPACNCGDQWFHGGMARERLMEIAAAVPHNGRKLLDVIEEMVEHSDRSLSRSGEGEGS